MGKLLSTKNRALPAVDGYVLKGNTDGSQFWASPATGNVTTINAVLVVSERDDSFTTVSLSNYTYTVPDRSGAEVTISGMSVTTRAGLEAPLQSFITSVS